MNIINSNYLKKIEDNFLDLINEETILNIHDEYLCSAFFNVHLYSDFNKFIYLVGVEGIEPTPPK